MKALWIGAATASMIACVAHAETGETTKDVRCMAAYSYLIGTTTDQAAKGSLAIGLFYYQGRIDGREPALDFVTAFKREVYAMSEEETEVELRRCDEAVRARSRQMQAIGKSLEAEQAAP